jgi:hypothetical protein
MLTTPLLSPLQRTLLAACTGVTAILVTSTASGQAPAAAGTTAVDAQPAAASVDPQSLSCKDLKAQLSAAGQMSILSGPRGGWGDTFYGPAVPQCPFWQAPQFTYVRARDGLCGVGFVCIDKNPMD